MVVDGPFDLESSPERTQMDGVNDIFGDDLSSNATQLHQHREKAEGKRPSALSDTDEEQQQDEHEVISSSDKPAKELAEYMFGDRWPELEEKCDEYPRVEFLQTVVKRQDSYKPTPVEDSELIHMEDMDKAL